MFEASSGGVRLDGRMGHQGPDISSQPAEDGASTFLTLTVEGVEGSCCGGTHGEVRGQLMRVISLLSRMS